MIIDLGNIENLLIKSNKKAFSKGLEYFSKIKVENSKNVFYSLTRSTELKDIDINFILTFLYKLGFIELDNAKITKCRNFETNSITEELIFFYYSILTNNEELSTALFINSKFNVIDDEILIDISSVQIKYRTFFLILQNLDLLIKTDEKGIFIIKNYTLAKKFMERPLRKISPQEFEKQQEQKYLYGLEAEKFVLAFEKKRVGDKNIYWFPEHIVNEGYDILSYNYKDDNIYNRFIEVKSYYGKNPYFYWSRNEIDIAKRKLDSYWVYLVNRKEINDTDYSPIMIQNPIESIMKDDHWDKQIEKYKIHLVKS